FSSRRRHTRCYRDWSSDVCSSDLELMQRFAELVGGYLAGQARAGARALQLFDSWVGCLSPADYATYVFPHSQRALELAGASGVRSEERRVGKEGGGGRAVVRAEEN